MNYKEINDRWKIFLSENTFKEDILIKDKPRKKPRKKSKKILTSEEEQEPEEQIEEMSGMSGGAVQGYAGNAFEEDKSSLQENPKKKEDRCIRIAKSKYSSWPSAYASGAVEKCRQGKIWKDLKEEDELEEARKLGKPSSETSLRDWFKRKGAPGKKGGWVDCNTCRDGDCKPCGRQEGEKRSKYPRCRPTPSQCKGYKRRGDNLQGGKDE